VCYVQAAEEREKAVQLSAEVHSLQRALAQTQCDAVTSTAPLEAMMVSEDSYAVQLSTDLHHLDARLAGARRRSAEGGGGSTSAGKQTSAGPSIARAASHDMSGRPHASDAANGASALAMLPEQRADSSMRRGVAELEAALGQHKQHTKGYQSKITDLEGELADLQAERDALSEALAAADGAVPLLHKSNVLAERPLPFKVRTCTTQ
jgi:hypothetical protein